MMKYGKAASAMKPLAIRHASPSTTTEDVPAAEEKSSRHLSRLIRFNIASVIPLTLLLFTVLPPQTLERFWRILLLVFVLSNVNYLALWHFYFRVWRPLMTRTTYASYAILAVGALPVIAIVTAAVVRGMLTLLKVFVPWVPIASFSYLATLNILFVMLYGMAIFMIEDKRLALQTYGKRLADTEQKTGGLEAELDRSRLIAMQMFLKSHFIFNTLNAIATLIHEDPATAEAVTLGLARVLRSILEMRDRELVPLETELNIIREYVRIEQVRLGQRLSFDVELTGGIEDVAIPPMILQPLIENAIQHGVRQRRDGGAVRLAASREDGHLHVSIIDNGPGFSSHAGSGQALKLLRERLRHSYGDDFDLTLSRCPDRGETIMSVVVPIQAEGNR